MASTGVKLLVACLVLAIVAVIYFTSKATPAEGISCIGVSKRTCPDRWTGIGGPWKDATAADQVCANEKVTPGLGPGSCQVACPAGYVACWSEKRNAGGCWKGTECPCESGGCNSGTCDGDTGACVCRDGYMLPDCKNKATVACTAAMCGPRGKCAPDGVTCECDEGWGPAFGASPCAKCKPGRGPPGDCSRYEYGEVPPAGAPTPETSLKVTLDACQNQNRSWPDLDTDCRGVFGQRSAVSHSLSHGVCGGDGNKSIAGKVCKEGQGRVVCLVPHYYASLGFNPDTHPVCPPIGPTGITPRPAGFVLG